MDHFHFLFYIFSKFLNIYFNENDKFIKIYQENIFLYPVFEIVLFFNLADTIEIETMERNQP